MAQRVSRWYLVLGGVAVGRGFDPQSDLEHFFSENQQMIDCVNNCSFSSTKMNINTVL
jgi:hypothetical protein